MKTKCYKQYLIEQLRNPEAASAFVLLLTLQDIADAQAGNELNS